MSGHCWLVLVLCGVSVYCEGVCEAQAKGDTSCSQETNHNLDMEGKYGVTPLSYGDVKWQDFLWRDFQDKDLSHEDTRDPLKRFSLNVVASSKLSPDRSIPDNRDGECQHVQYSSSLPHSSVIITFRTEARSTLLRTVVSVLTRTPPELLREIILVDDNNEDESVGKELARIEKVKSKLNTFSRNLLYFAGIHG